MISIDEGGKPGGAAGRRDDSVKLVLVHERVDALGGPELMVFREAIHVFFLGQRSLCLRLNENILAKIWHLFFAIAFIEVDDVFEGVDGRAGAETREISVQIGLELGQENGAFGIVKLAEG